MKTTLSSGRLRTISRNAVTRRSMSSSSSRSGHQRSSSFSQPSQVSAPSGRCFNSSALGVPSSHGWRRSSVPAASTRVRMPRHCAPTCSNRVVCNARIKGVVTTTSAAFKAAPARSRPASTAWFSPWGVSGLSTRACRAAAEYEHNCLDDALADYQCIKVNEATLLAMKERSLRLAASTGDMATTAPATMTSSASSGTLRSTFQRAALGTLRDVNVGFEFVIMLWKSSPVQARNSRRRPIEPRTNTGVIVNKLNVEVTDVGGKILRVENVHEGLVTTWNRTNPAFQVRQGDMFIKVNQAKANAAAMLEELTSASDAVRITVRRAPPEPRKGSKAEWSAAGD